jgi:hypothetical protein
MPRPTRYITRWRVECTVCTADGRDFWVRWVSPGGEAFWLHSDERVWIEAWRVWRLPEPMPFFASEFVARAAILTSPSPVEKVRGNQWGSKRSRTVPNPHHPDTLRHAR